MLPKQSYSQHRAAFDQWAVIDDKRKRGEENHSMTASVSDVSESMFENGMNKLPNKVDALISDTALQQQMKRLEELRSRVNSEVNNLKSLPDIGKKELSKNDNNSQLRSGQNLLRNNIPHMVSSLADLSSQKDEKNSFNNRRNYNNSNNNNNNDNNNNDNNNGNNNDNSNDNNNDNSNDNSKYHGRSNINDKSDSERTRPRRGMTSPSMNSVIG
jgi:hypothetical protein